MELVNTLYNITDIISVKIYAECLLRASEEESLLSWEKVVEKV